MSRRTLRQRSARVAARASRTAPSAGPVLHLDLATVAVALAEPGAQLLRRDAHGEQPGAVRRPGEGTVSPSEGGQAAEDELAVRVGDLHLDRRQLRDVEADRGGLLLGRRLRAFPGELGRVDLIAAVAAGVVAV